ncbi:MAG TPA: hypothetical protein VKQ71_03085, partial [Acidimicrobiales bacterium]|nr:hypothetical protein [Acidimicrobiales bacterium]
MTLPRTLGWRLRVRTPANDGDLFIADSLRQAEAGGYNYVSRPPTFDGLQIDPVTGDVTVGAATIRVIDQFATITESADGTAIPAPPPAPGNLLIGDALRTGTWTLDYAAAVLTGTYPPPTGFSFDGWPGPNGFELWNVYSGPIGGSGHFLRHGVFTGLPASTPLVVRAFEASFADFQPRGVGVPAPYGAGTFYTTDDSPPPPLKKGWTDIPCVSDASGALHIDVGWGTTVPSDANVIYMGALMVFDATGTPPGGGSPAGTGPAFSTGPGRLVTSYLADLTARMRMLNLQAVIEETRDGGASWTTIFAGFVGTATQASAMSYDITLTDTRRIDLVTTFLQASGAAAISILGTIGQ